MTLTEKYEAVIGLEIHAQLLTKTKAYSSDENIYGKWYHLLYNHGKFTYSVKA